MDNTFSNAFRALLLGVCAAALCYGQAVNGSLLGTITDASGASVPSAKVTITEVNTGISRGATTNESGNYVFSNLSPGTYSVTVEKTGFRKEVRSGIAVLVNSTMRVDLQLTPGRVTETVNVTAEAPMLQTDRTDTGRKIQKVQVEDLPLSYNRNFQGLLNLVPGTTRAFRPHSEFFNPQDSLSTQVNGQSRLANNLQLEGIDDNERTGLLQVLIPPIESIQTVDVTTSDYEAELGRAGGAVTNVILKSGTNDFHGAGYWFNRASALSARNFFDPTRGHFTYNYLGGNFGGPIIKNRTFFFGDYLRVWDHRAATFRETIPTMAFRSGDLSSSPTTIYDPATGNPDGTGRQPFAGNLIPANRINAISNKIMGLVPAPNLGGVNNNYFANTPFSKDTDSFDIKIDHNQTDNDRISVRYSFQRPSIYDSPIFGLAGGPKNGGFQGTGVQRMQSTAVNYDHIFSPTFLAEFRAGVNRYRNDAKNADYGTDAATQLGIPGANVSPFTSGMPYIQIGSYSNPVVGYSPSMPWERAETNFNFVNNWTKTLGNHTIKWGADLRRVRDDLLQTQTFSPRGRFNFGQGQTSIPGAKTSYGNDFASFLLDVPSQVGRDLPIIFPAYRAWQLFTFVQDKWVATPKLTVDIGLRWEFYPPATPHFAGGFSNYDPTTNSLVIAGVGGNPLNLGINTNYHDFAPRIGLAYRLTDKTVIRSGFGISYAPYPDNSYAYNFPVKQNNAFNPQYAGFGPAVLPNGSVATFQNGFPPPTPAEIPSNGIIPNADLNQVYDVVNSHFREPYVESWNFAIQRVLPANFTLDVAYVGNHGVEQPANYNINAATVIGLGNNGRPYYKAFGRKADTHLRYRGFSSSYNALQVKLDRHFSKGLLVTTAYTFSKAMGYQSEDSGLAYYIDPSRNWSRTSFDRTQTFVQSYVWELPFGKGKRWLSSGVSSKILGGWQVNGILTLMTGTPFFFSYSSSSLLAPGNSQTPDITGPLQILHGIGPGNPWFSTSNFSAPAPLTFGNLGRAMAGGPGFFNLDGSLFRDIQITERAQLEVRAESLSLTNTPQFSNPGTSLGSSNFGYVTGAGGGRVMQMGVKLTF